MNAKVESPIMARLFEQKATSSPSPSPSPKAVAPDVTEKNEHVEMWDRGWDDETQANPVFTRTKSKPILWVLVAIAVGAVAGGGYVYFTRKANAPAQLPIQVPVPRIAQKPVPATIPNTQPMPPQPVSPEPNVDTPLPHVNSATSRATFGPKAGKTKSATTKPGDAKTAQPPKSVSREKHAATSSASKNAQTTESNAQFESPAPLKSQVEMPVATSAKLSLERELEGCRKMGFFEKGICTERARWKYCNVGRVWDSAKPGCEIN